MKPYLLVVSLVMVALACGKEIPEADVEGCEHLVGGPSIAVSAAVDGGAPAVAGDHRRYDISLSPSGTGDRAGTVSFAVADPGDWVFFLDVDVPLVVRTTGGATVAFEEEAASSVGCAEVKARKVAALSVGTHLLDFGPTSVEKVSLVLEPSEHEGHEH